MRTKTLLITAALAAAGLVSASAQVFSVNAVGYVNITVPPVNPTNPSLGGYAILANPLNGNPDNSLNTILQMTDNEAGCNVYRFNAAAQTYYETMTYLGPADGWLAAAPGDLILAPGEGFFFRNITGAALTLTFVGEVPAGNPTVNSVSGGTLPYSIKAAKVPRSGRLGWVGLAGSLEFPSDVGDNVYVFNSATQTYKETYTFLGVPDGWLHDVDPIEGPNIDPGNGFFIRNAGATKNWNMPFSVN